jgi:hypothetical protein
MSTENLVPNSPRQCFFLWRKFDNLGQRNWEFFNFSSVNLTSFANFLVKFRENLNVLKK